MRDLTDAPYASYIHAHPAYYAVESFCDISQNDYYYSLLDIPQYGVHHYANNKKPWTYISFWSDINCDSGWKIHISATLNNHKEILKKVAKFAFKNMIPFKFAINENEFININSKTINRPGSGKFIVLYPTPSKFESVIDELYVMLRGYQGPYILSDNQYKDSEVVYYRYGEFLPIRFTDPFGTLTTRILDGKNKLVIDRRNPFYSVPDWIEEPFLADESHESSVLLSKYNITSAIKFSAQGGVYISEQQGKKYIIKEARAFAAIDQNQMYGTDRLRREYNKLIELENLSVLPKPIELLEEQGNVYLVEEFINGFSLLSYPHNNSCLIHRVQGGEAYARKCKSFFEELKRIIDLTLLAVDKIHSAGVAIGDISPSNIIYDRDTQQVHIIDLEVADYISNVGPQYVYGLYTPGYSVPSKQLSPVQIDMHKLGLVFLHCIMPYDGLIELCPEKAFELLDTYNRNKTVPVQIVSVINNLLSDKFGSIKEVLQLCNSSEVPTIAGYEKTHIDCNAVLKEIQANIRMFLNKREHPFGNDPMGALTNDYSWGYGIFGMMYAINKLDPLNMDKRLIDDAVHAFLYEFYQEPAKYTAGFYIGLSGIAFSLCELGYESESQTIIEHAVKAECPIYDFAYGKAGRASILLHFYNKFGEKKYLDWALADVHCIMDDYQVIEDGLYWPDTEQSCYSGLTRGNAGISLVLLQAYMVTKNSKYLDFGTKVVNGALARLELLENGFIGFNSYPIGQERTVYSPYVHNGLSGLGNVLVRYFLVTQDGQYADAIEKTIEAIEYKYLLHSGYLTGISGVLSFLQDCKYILKNNKCDLAIQDLLENLTFQYVNVDGYAGFAGDQSFKISHDLLTGSMGALLIIDRSKYTKKANPFMLVDSVLFEDNNCN